MSEGEPIGGILQFFLCYFFEFQTSPISSLGYIFLIGVGLLDIAQERRPLLDLTGLKPENVLKSRVTWLTNLINSIYEQY